MAAAVAAVTVTSLIAVVGSSISSAATEKSITISVASLIPGSTPEAITQFNNQVKEFQKANPSIHVNSVEYQWTGPTFAAKLAAGTLPTVFTVPFTDARTLGDNGQIADLTKEVKALPYYSKFNPAVLAEGTTSKQKIVALPTSLVGSIGVIFTRPVVEELMQKVGVRMVTTHEGKLKAMFQPWKEPTAEEQAKVQALTEEYYEWFVNSVATSRNLPVEKVREIATGEMYSAAKGKDLGLVDELGDFERATDLAKELAKMAEMPRLQWVRPRRPLIERLMARTSASMAQALFNAAETSVTPRIDFR